MENELLVTAQIREHTGTKAAQKLRKNDRIPAVVYGHKKEPVAIDLDRRTIVEGLHHGHRLMSVQIGRKKERMIVKDLQYDYLGKNIIHLDLMRVDVTETVKVTVPIELKGTAKGTQEGGIIEVHTDHLEVECKVTDIPEAIVVMVKEIGLGDTVHAGDIELPDGVRLVSSPETLVVTCSLVAAAKTTEEIEEETPVTPEVISEAKGPEEEQASEGQK